MPYLLQCLDRFCRVLTTCTRQRTGQAPSFVEPRPTTRSVGSQIVPLCCLTSVAVLVSALAGSKLFYPCFMSIYTYTNVYYECNNNNNNYYYFIVVVVVVVAAAAAVVVVVVVVVVVRLLLLLLLTYH